MGFCKVALTFESVEETQWSDHSNETSLTVLTHGATCFSKFHKMKFGISCRILPLATFGSERVKASHDGMSRRPSRRGRTLTTMKSTKSVLHVQRCCCADQPIAFLKFSLPWPSSHLNVPFQGKGDGNNIRVVLITLNCFSFVGKLGRRS